MALMRRQSLVKFDAPLCETIVDTPKPQGKEVLVPYRGPVSGTVEEILGGVRSACTYVGARRLRELSKRTTFIRVTQQSNEVFGKS